MTTISLMKMLKSLSITSQLWRVFNYIVFRNYKNLNEVILINQSLMSTSRIYMSIHKIQLPLKNCEQLLLIRIQNHRTIKIQSPLNPKKCNGLSFTYKVFAKTTIYRKCFTDFVSDAAHGSLFIIAI